LIAARNPKALEKPALKQYQSFFKPFQAFVAFINANTSIPFGSLLVNHHKP
jgi:hypothetical protein